MGPPTWRSANESATIRPLRTPLRPDALQDRRTRYPPHEASEPVICRRAGDSDLETRPALLVLYQLVRSSERRLDSRANVYPSRAASLVRLSPTGEQRVFRSPQRHMPQDV